MDRWLSLRLGLMIASVLATFIYFRRKGWM